MADPPRAGPKTGVMGPRPGKGQGPIPKNWFSPSQVEEAQTAGSCGVSCPDGAQYPAPGFLGQYSGAQGLSSMVLPADRQLPHIGKDIFSGNNLAFGG